MGKKSKAPAAPTYSSGVYMYGNTPVSQTYQNGNSIVSQYMPSAMEESENDYLQSSFLSNLGNVNVFSDQVSDNINSQLNANYQEGVNTINQTYLPMINNLETDVASRFGNLDNSSFLNSLGSIESKRADAVAELANDLLTKRNELETDQLSKQYDYLNFLQDAQANNLENALSSVEASNTASGSGNDYNTEVYSQLMKNYMNDQDNSANVKAALIRALGSLGSSYYRSKK